MLIYSAAAGRVGRSWLSGPILFTGAGLVLGPAGLGVLDLPLTAADLRILAEISLAMVLFTDAAHADLSVSEVLVKSSNIGVCKLAVQLGEQKFYEYVRRFGFGDQTGVGLPHEENGILAPPYRWSKISISRLPMGQEINVTAIQITAAMSATAT